MSVYAGTHAPCTCSYTCIRTYWACTAAAPSCQTRQTVPSHGLECGSFLRSMPTVNTEGPGLSGGQPPTEGPGWTIIPVASMRRRWPVGVRRRHASSCLAKKKGMPEKKRSAPSCDPCHRRAGGPSYGVCERDDTRSTEGLLLRPDHTGAKVQP